MVLIQYRVALVFRCARVKVIGNVFGVVWLRGLNHCKIKPLLIYLTKRIIFGMIKIVFNVKIFNTKAQKSKTSLIWSFLISNTYPIRISLCITITISRPCVSYKGSTSNIYRYYTNLSCIFLCNNYNNNIIIRYGKCYKILKTSLIVSMIMYSIL